MTAQFKNIVRAKSRTFLRNYDIFKVTSRFAFGSLRRIFWICFLLLTFALYASPTNAQTLRLANARSGPSASTPSATTPTTNYQLPTTIPPTSPLYTDLLVNNLFHTFSCLAIGQSIIGQPCLTYQLTQNAQGMIQGIPVLSQTNLSGGTLGAVTSVIGMLYTNPPIRTADYLASVGEGLGIAKVANAQGVTGSGAAVLNPILQLWQVSRNISYVIMIIIFLIIGLMVMFRNKINPQTVITAQTALPGLVIGLVMITFSYFFAGLISDMAFVGTNVVGFYFQAAQGIALPDQTNIVQNTQGQSVLAIFSKFVGIIKQEDAARAVDTIFNSFTEEVKNYLRIFVGIISFQMGAQVGGVTGPFSYIVSPILGLISATAIQTAISPTLGLIISIVVVAILIFTMLKLLLRLINNYITILFLTITAPFQFLIASLPGRQGIATGWMLNMLANILAFPAVMAVFYLVNYLLGSTAIINSPFPVGVDPSITGAASFPLFGGMDISLLRIMVALGALMATPAIPDIINRTVGKVGPAGQLIGQEIGSGVGRGRGFATQTGQGGFGAARSVGGALTGESTFYKTESGFNRVVQKPSVFNIRSFFRQGGRTQ